MPARQVPGQTPEQPSAPAMLEQAWARIAGTPPPDSVNWTGAAGLLPSRLPVAALAGASVGAAALAAAELAAVRSDRPDARPPEVTVDTGAVAAAFASERHLRLNGEPQTGWAPLSRFWPAADGWVRTHGNYPHHQKRLLAALGLPVGADEVRAVGAAIAERTAEEVAERVTAAGGLALQVRSSREWAAHAQGAAVAAQPLLRLLRGADAGPARLGPLPAGPLLPAAGLRVLDLTRTIAGPVATRTLAVLGADVLRIDSPRLPEIPEQHLHTGFGKRSALLDLEHRADRERLAELIAGADAVVTGYRPGALERFGLGPAELLERHPALTVARLSAWGTVGPWADRRGFDSLVQAASGIAVLEAAPDGTPGALPVQALDHATGYLLAAVVLRAQSRKQLEGGGWLAELSLAQTAAWLLRQPRLAAPEDGAEDQGVQAWLADADTPLGRVRHVLTPVHLDGSPRDWAQPVRPWGTDTAVWR